MIKQVILIEDDDAMRLSLTQTLDLEEITVIAANSLMQAKRNIRANFPGIIISDIRMPRNDGFDVLAYVKSVDNELPTIMLTGEADVPMALQAIKSGAYDFLEKPCPRGLIEHRCTVSKKGRSCAEHASDCRKIHAARKAVV